MKRRLFIKGILGIVAYISFGKKIMSKQTEKADKSFTGGGWPARDINVTPEIYDTVEFYKAETPNQITLGPGTYRFQNGTIIKIA